VYEAAFEALDVTSGTRLLDAGCGSGLALVLAAERGAAVTGVDASEALLALARDRLRLAELRVGDLEALPFRDGTFEVVTAFNAVQYAEDQQAAVAELARVLRPGGRLAVATWGTPESCQTRVVLAAIASLLPPAGPGAGGPFALSAPGALTALLATAGLVAERALDVPCPFVYPDLDTAVRAQLSPGPVVRAIDHAGLDPTATALRRAFADAVRPDGSVRHDNTFHLVIARKPGSDEVVSPVQPAGRVPDQPGRQSIGTLTGSSGALPCGRGDGRRRWTARTDGEREGRDGRSRRVLRGRVA
jgi:hypothetical protein